jgi:peptidoglycan/LPS O-acetylase OafA/YrhL
MNGYIDNAGKVHRLAYPETLRGIAACAVVLAHLLMTARFQGLPAEMIGSAIRTPLAILINGPGAVIFFFTLSGYVLTLRAIETSDAGLVVRGAIKRWPRLAGPVLLSTLFSCAILHLG